MTERYVAGQRVRKLGASEYLVHLIQQRLVRLIEFDGPVNPQTMERAFRNMVARRPILRARIPPTEPGTRPHFVIEDEPPPGFTVRARRGPDDWVEVVHHELNAPLGLDGESPIRAQLLCADQAPGGELVLACLHTACDGRSLFRFSRELLQEYEALARGEPGDPAITASRFGPPVEDVLPEWATPERGAAIVAEFLDKRARLPRPFPWPSERDRSAAPKSTHFLRFDVPAEQVTAVRAAARANGTTVHGVLGAAAIEAFDEILAPPRDAEHVITTTLDIRQDLRVPVAVEDMGIYAATLPSHHPVEAGLGSWDLARDFRNQVSEGVAKHEHYAFVFMGEQFVETFTAAGSEPMMTNALANLGMMELQTEGTSLQPRVIRGAVNVHQGEWPFVSLNSVGINGSMAMTAAYMHPHISDDRAREFVASLTGRIRWFAANPR